MKLADLLKSTRHFSQTSKAACVSVTVGHATALQREPYFHLDDYAVSTATTAVLYLTPRVSPADRDQMGAQGMELENGIE